MPYSYFKTVIIVFLFLFSSFILPAEDDKDDSVVYKKASNEIRTGKYLGASKRLKEHLKSNPGDFRSLLLLLVRAVLGDPVSPEEAVHVVR